MDGPASAIGLPLSSSIARTRPHSDAGHDDVALLQRAALHQHGADRATAAIQTAFDHRALGRAVRIGPQVEDFGLQQDRFLQLVEAGLLQRGHLDILGFAAHFLDHDVVAEQFLPHAVRDWRRACPSC